MFYHLIIFPMSVATSATLFLRYHFTSALVNYLMTSNNFPHVRIPCKRMLDTVTCTAKGVSGNEKLLFKETQGFCTDFRKGEHSSSSTSSEPLVPKVPFVVKPPEKKHRLPSTYNRFMKEEIQRIKAANPEIPHREAFSTAAKNWARYLPNSGAGSGGRKN
ncbi:hypothetical protein NC651_024907 [Populus alba x Populus x berolinensis]|nr:hypothetical protein NC651_024907 [Populus alba x Populus x berolinensis]